MWVDRVSDTGKLGHVKAKVKLLQQDGNWNWKTLLNRDAKTQYAKIKE